MDAVRSTPLSADLWQVQQLRLTTFPVMPTDAIIACDLWRKVLGVEEESNTQKKDVRVVEGIAENLRIQLVLEPDRLEWRFAPDVDPDALPSDIPAIGPFSDTLSRCDRYIRPFLTSDCPAIKRLAFGAVLSQGASTYETGYQTLKRYLPSVTVSPESADFLYRINRKRHARSLSGESLLVNRLSTWNVVRYVLQIVKVRSTEVTVDSPPERIACRAELDINTDATREAAIPQDQLLPLWDELIGLGREIAVQWTPLSRPKSCDPSLLFRQAILAPTPYTSAGVR